ncbi:hypothetical protein EVAR_102244_1 [Eumeta japonica]|uniref:Uncharacterized protein n=1 Tax=Eumeta variegata TaxID=151549 RepID=A0A4C1WDW0_EUMVA|nr:hypothetical protein EVAR_102244_1 [Eumeta japonica]
MKRSNRYSIERVSTSSRIIASYFIGHRSSDHICNVVREVTPRSRDNLTVDHCLCIHTKHIASTTDIAHFYMLIHGECSQSDLKSAVFPIKYQNGISKNRAYSFLNRRQRDSDLEERLFVFDGDHLLSGDSHAPLRFFKIIPHKNTS